MDPNILKDYLDSLEIKGIPGCECLIYQNHRPVFSHAAGNAKAKLLSYWIFSASKVITCTAVMQLVEKGRIRLDDPVSEYLPEYGNMKVKRGTIIEPAKNTMTIRHLLSMQSGLNYNIESPSIR